MTKATDKLSYYSTTAILVRRTSLNIKLYIHCLSCYSYIYIWNTF